MDKSKQAFKARERRLRAKYLRKLRIAIILCLVIGLAGGFVAGRMSVSGMPGTATATPAPTAVAPLATPEVTAAPTPTVVPSSAPAAIVTTIPTAEPTEIPTAEPAEAPTAAVTAEATADAAEATADAVEATAEPTAEVTAEPTAEVTAEPTPDANTPSVTVIPCGQTQVIPIQVYADGSARNDTQALPYETLEFQMTVKRLMDNDYYTSTYGATHRLEDGTAGVEFELMLNNYQGSTPIDPNKVIKNASIESADGMVTYGYRLTDKEISGKDASVMQTNVPVTLYKRFVESDAQSLYLVVTVTIDGVNQVYKFDLAPTAEPTAAVEYTTLNKGSKGDEVKALQTRLIEKGYLEEGSNDGVYGSGTAEAVKKAQTELGLTVDGIAGPEFQSAIYAD